MSEMVRVVLMLADGNADGQIIVDMAVDEGGVAVGPFPAFGRVGDYKKVETLFPFTLMMDGRMDYGAHAPAEASQGKLMIRNARLAEGEKIALVDGDRTTDFTIAGLTRLAAG